MKKNKTIKGDFVYEDLGDKVRCRDIFFNNVISVVPKKRGCLNMESYVVSSRGYGIKVTTGQKAKR